MERNYDEKTGGPAAAHGFSFTGENEPVKEICLADYLGTGRESARTARELSGALGVSWRDISAAVERERRAGAPICAATGDPKGYYLAKDAAEMEEYARSLTKRAGRVDATRDAVAATAGRMRDGEA